jgi:hypothetical protein
MDRDPSSIYYPKNEVSLPTQQQEGKPQQRNWPLYDASDEVSGYASKKIINNIFTFPNNDTIENYFVLLTKFF